MEAHQTHPRPLLSAAPGSAVRPDLSMAERFLRLLDPSARAFDFRLLFPEERGRKEPVNLRGTLRQHWPKMVRLNEAGYGIFVTVQETDGKGRKTANISRVRAVFADWDDGMPEGELPPVSMLVETSPGKFQGHWLLADTMSFEQFAAVMERVVSPELKGDTRAKDLARVLRLPGTFHTKGTPHLATLEDDSGRRYSASELMLAFGATTKGSEAAPASEAAVPRAREKRRPGGAGSDRAKIADAVAFLGEHMPDLTYADWLENVGMPLHHEFGGNAEGLALWIECSSANDYGRFAEAGGRDGLAAKWASMGSGPHGRRKGIGSLFKMARDLGWRWPRVVGPIDWPVHDGKRPAATSRKNVEALLAHLAVNVGFDEMALRYCIDDFESSRELSDSDLDALWARAHELGLEVSADNLARLVRVIGYAARFHPVRRYLDRLRWDGKPRVGEWLARYCGASDTPLARAAGALFLVAAVRRVRQPGCKFDAMLVLEGEQGAGKSSVGRILAGTWFTDNLQLGQDPKVTIEQTLGAWVVEIAELGGMRGREVEGVKAMITRQEDRARLAYERATRDVKRQFVMLGTTNDERYLRDRTGNRRFLPVRVGATHPIDLDSLKLDRDQLWAEAVAIERDHGPLELPRELWAEATAQQTKRLATDAAEDLLDDIMGDPVAEGFVPSTELWQALGLKEARDVREHHSAMLARVAQRHGWEAKRLRGDGLRQRGWQRGGDDDPQMLCFAGVTHRLVPRTTWPTTDR